MRVADRGGLAKVSMRNVGAELGVEAMSLYHHVDGKEALLDALADVAFTLVEFDPEDPWRPAMTARAATARAAFLAHPWALGLVDSRRNPGPALLHHHDAVLGCLRRSGFPVDLAAHAFSALDSYVYGFVLTELTLPMAPGEDVEQFVATIDELVPVETYPHLREMFAAQVVGGGYAYANEFGFGLDLLLDGLERQLAAISRPGRAPARPRPSGPSAPRGRR